MTHRACNVRRNAVDHSRSPIGSLLPPTRFGPCWNAPLLAVLRNKHSSTARVPGDRHGRDASMTQPPVPPSGFTPPKATVATTPPPNQTICSVNRRGDIHDIVSPGESHPGGASSTRPRRIPFTWTLLVDPSMLRSSIGRGRSRRAASFNHLDTTHRVALHPVASHNCHGWLLPSSPFPRCPHHPPQRP